MLRCSTSCCATSHRRWCVLARARGVHAQAGFEMLIQQMPHYLNYFGHADAAEGLRADANFLREIVYPASMQGEILQPLRYHSASVA